MGMVCLRGDLSDPGVAEAVRAATGLAVPGTRGLSRDGARAVAWMSPDELLLLLPADAVADALRGASEAVTLVDVSDARAAFHICGPRADEVVMKLCPVDIARLPDGEIRRTRAARIAVALWRSAPSTLTLICARSVAGHARNLLENAARPGGEVFASRPRG
ncbi:hypothetical protein CCR87_11575 [Rhodobaculum claviforme]|uniref:Sarcosine oxidase subunit gamma n=2 Tax=Rhodobaculum claviforme TaxID=1549854 RepID=A0A934WJX2_9RHOB|nr:hypothetical protein [Rhodobaculum claviforme]